MIIFSGVSQRLTAIYIPCTMTATALLRAHARIKLSYFIPVCNGYNNNNNNTHIYICMQLLLVV